MSWSEDSGVLVDVSPGKYVCVTVRFAGELDFGSAAAARDALAELVRGNRQVVVDLSRVTFLDVAGVRSLLVAQERAVAGGGNLVVRHPSRSVRRILELTGTLPLLCPDEAASPAPAAAPDPQIVSACERAVAKLMEAGTADMADAQIVEPSRRALRIIAQDGFRSRFLDFFEIVHDEESACGTALANGSPVWVPDVARSPIFAGTPARDVMLGAGSKSVASVPVLAGDGRLVAMISAHRRQPGPWPELQRQHLHVLAAGTARFMPGKAPAYR